VVFADDSNLWMVGSRFVRAVRPDSDARFSVAGLPSGAYRVIARDLVLEGQWEHPAFLQGLVKRAVRVELGEGAVETVQLRLEKER
jgi:hypothetical protein